jgi:hypothetical protein
MLGCRDPSSSQDGPTSQSPSPRRTFSSRITLTMMLWSYLVSSRDFLSTMFWLIQVVVGVKAKTLPFARCLRRSHRTNGGKATGSFHPSSNTLQDEGLRRGRPVSRPRPTRRPMRNSAHCIRPRAAECITGPICKGFSVMTVCNPFLWEYSGDDLGA